VGLLHGRIAQMTKDAVMEQFRTGRLQVLVPRVIEVGIERPQATIMIVEGMATEADCGASGAASLIAGLVVRGPQNIVLVLRPPR